MVYLCIWEVIQTIALLYLMNDFFHRIGGEATRRIESAEHDCKYRINSVREEITRLANPADEIAKWEKQIKFQQSELYERMAALENEIERLKSTPAYQSRQATREAVIKLKGGY